MSKITIEYSVANNEDDVTYHITNLLQSCLPYMVDNVKITIDLEDEEEGLPHALMTHDAEEEDIPLQHEE